MNTPIALTNDITHTPTIVQPAKRNHPRQDVMSSPYS